MTLQQASLLATTVMPFLLLVGSYVAIVQLRDAARLHRLTMAIEILKEIRDELFRDPAGEFLRHKICGYDRTLTLEEIKQYFPSEKEQSDIRLLLMAHDRFALFVEIGGPTADHIFEWQRHEVLKIWTAMKLMIREVDRTKPEGFCHKLTILAAEGPDKLRRTKPKDQAQQARRLLVW